MELGPLQMCRHPWGHSPCDFLVAGGLGLWSVGEHGAPSRVTEAQPPAEGVGGGALLLCRAGSGPADREGGAGAGEPPTPGWGAGDTARSFLAQSSAL